MIRLLQEYLRIDTSYPRLDYKEAIACFKKHAIADGFELQEITLPSGYPVCIITLPGSSPELPAVALNHHMDVVQADTADSRWKYPPFAGTADNNTIYGRGTQDCKGLGVAHYAALRKLKMNNIAPSRTIHMLMVPDEERGGFHGTKEFINNPLFDSLHIGYLLDEGMPSGHTRQIFIKIDERTPLQFSVRSHGTQGHASGLYHKNCIHALTNFLTDVTAFHAQQQQRGLHNPAHVISMQITSYTAGDPHALNVIPAQAEATIDMRIPSSISLDDGIAIMDTIAQKHPDVTYTIVASSQERLQPVSLDNILYQTLAAAIREQDLEPHPFSFEATTDARFYSQKGIVTLGVTPFRTAANLHGINESITIDDLDTATAIFYNFLRTFCA